MRASAEKLKLWREKPQAFVREVFGVVPDKWQDEELEAFPHQQRQGLRACKGPGKTAWLAWIAWNFLLTRPHPKVAATSISATNLADNLWSEMAKWQKRSQLLSSMFTWSQTRIVCNESPETWWMSARSWPRQGSAEAQADTLAGLHADYILFMLDESGGIPDAVMVAAEAALSSCVEGHLLQAGNPTHLQGPLYRASTKDSKLWRMRSITGDPDDPARSPRVSVEWARQQIESYGRDNPWVLVNVFGQFPPSSINTLIGPDEIEASYRRLYHEPELYLSALVAGLDVARFGDDASVLFPRRGLQAYPPHVWRNLNGVQGAGHVARLWADEGSRFDAVFVDNTGGYGTSWIDQLQMLGRSPLGIGFADKANNARYANKRAEMYFDAAEWIKKGGALPQCPELMAAFTQTTYTFQGDRLLLEPKDQVKVKIGYSPDHADAFALTFAQPVVSTNAHRMRGNSGIGRVAVEYDPYAGMMDEPSQSN